MDERSIDIDAPPDRVYDLVADISQMGRWSPETYRAEWRRGASGPATGAQFRGWNKRGLLRWFTDCQVEQADLGRAFAFRVKGTGARWGYRLETSNGGTRLTETRDLSGSPAVGQFLNRLMRQDDSLRQGMEQTLQRIKAAAESEST